MRVRCHLRDLRGKRPLSELEAETGINRGSLSQIESGRMLPHDKWLPALEAAYGAPKTAWYEPEVLLVIEYPEGEPA